MATAAAILAKANLEHQRCLDRWEATPDTGGRTFHGIDAHLSVEQVAQLRAQLKEAEGS